MADDRRSWFGARDLVEMWSNTRMVVLVAISAAVYAAVLIPFKIFPIIPGLTEFRPANALPPVTSFLFGPAGAWGSAFGNLIGDLFGTFGPGSFFGFLGNFLLGFIPYKVWRAFTRGGMPFQRSGGSRLGAEIAAFVALMVLSNAACAVVVAWGVDMLGFVEFRLLAPVILGNNTVAALLICPFLLRALGARVTKWGLTHDVILNMQGDSAGAEPISGSGRFCRTGALLLAIGTFGGLGVGLALSFSQSSGILGLALSPFVICMTVGVILL